VRARSVRQAPGNDRHFDFPSEHWNPPLPHAPADAFWRLNIALCDRGACALQARFAVVAEPICPSITLLLRRRCCPPWKMCCNAPGSRRRLLHVKRRPLSSHVLRVASSNRSGGNWRQLHLASLVAASPSGISAIIEGWPRLLLISSCCGHAHSGNSLRAWHSSFRPSVTTAPLWATSATRVGIQHAHRP
jgi:hypothetical protein